MSRVEYSCESITADCQHHDCHSRRSENDNREVPGLVPMGQVFERGVNVISR